MGRGSHPLNARRLQHRDGRENRPRFGEDVAEALADRKPRLRLNESNTTAVAWRVAAVDTRSS
jgi:hypothetical protein